MSHKTTMRATPHSTNNTTPNYDPTMYNLYSGKRWSIVTKLDDLLCVFDKANIEYNNHKYSDNRFIDAIKLLRKMIIASSFREIDEYSNDIIGDNIAFINKCDSMNFYLARKLLFYDG